MNKAVRAEMKLASCALDNPPARRTETVCVLNDHQGKCSNRPFPDQREGRGEGLGLSEIKHGGVVKELAAAGYVFLSISAGKWRVKTY
jgi:hypothetical protein